MKMLCSAVPVPGLGHLLNGSGISETATWRRRSIFWHYPGLETCFTVSQCSLSLVESPVTPKSGQTLIAQEVDGLNDRHCRIEALGGRVYM